MQRNDVANEHGLTIFNNPTKSVGIAVDARHRRQKLTSNLWVNLAAVFWGAWSERIKVTTNEWLLIDRLLWANLIVAAARQVVIGAISGRFSERLAITKVIGRSHQLEQHVPRDLYSA